jgi:hypothetical protein
MLLPRSQSAIPAIARLVEENRSAAIASGTVASNCGIGSRSLNREVKAFERLQMVRGRISSCFGPNAGCIVTLSCGTQQPPTPILS